MTLAPARRPTCEARPAAWTASPSTYTPPWKYKTTRRASIPSMVISAVGLDPRSRNEIWAVVRELRAQGTTLLLTTQYLEEADQLADRIAVIDRGKVIAQGTGNELKDRVGGQILEVELSTAGQRDRARRRAERGAGRARAVGRRGCARRVRHRPPELRPAREPAAPRRSDEDAGPPPCAAAGNRRRAAASRR